jgi:hypothetical protein
MWRTLGCRIDYQKNNITKKKFMLGMSIEEVEVLSSVTGEMKIVESKMLDSSIANFFYKNA